MSRRVVPVSRLVRYIKESMESDPVLRGVMIEGEISNLRIPNSQHWYFSLKDEKASLTCVMFAYQNKKVTLSRLNILLLSIKKTPEGVFPVNYPYRGLRLHPGSCLHLDSRWDQHWVPGFLPGS